MLGSVRGGVAALGLELVAEVADEAAVELEGEVGQLGGAEFGDAAVEVVEDRPVRAEAVGDHLGEWAARVAHEREASPRSRARAIEPKRVVALGVESEKSDFRIRGGVESLGGKT